MTPLGIVAALSLAALVSVLFRLKQWDQWHHGWLLIAALDLPPWVRLVCLVIGCDDLLQHLLRLLFGWKDASPFKQLYILLIKWTTD